jgi:hypothetical protein
MKKITEKEWAQIHKEFAQDEIDTAKYNFAKRVRAVVPDAPDKALEALAIYDPEAGRVIRYWKAQRRHYERLLRRPK